MLTLKKVNRVLEERGLHGVELKCHNGHFWFTGNPVEYADEVIVYGVAKLNQLTLERWVKEAERKVQMSRKRYNEIYGE